MENELQRKLLEMHDTWKVINPLKILDYDVKGELNRGALRTNYRYDYFPIVFYTIFIRTSKIQLRLSVLIIRAMSAVYCSYFVLILFSLTLRVPNRTFKYMHF